MVASYFEKPGTPAGVVQHFVSENRAPVLILAFSFWGSVLTNAIRPSKLDCEGMDGCASGDFHQNAIFCEVFLVSTSSI